MQELLNNPGYLWLTFGALLIIIEAFTVPGLGIFLGGLGALCTGLLLASGVFHEFSTGLQFVCFFSFTIIWAVLLWKPLMKFRTGGKNNKAHSYTNMVGDSATVAERGLKRGETGQVLWSGTLMNAQLADSVSVEGLPAGARVEIKSVSGNTLKVIPK